MIRRIRNPKADRVCLAFILAFIVCCGLPYIFAACAEGIVYTNRQAATYIATACDDYGEVPKTAEDILGNQNASDALTHASCAEMLYRGFGRLPTATGFRDVIGYRETAFTDVPDSITVYVKNLTDAMIYIPKNNLLFEPSAVMDEAELALLVDRIFAYLGTNLKDDYFTAVNKNRLFAPLAEEYDPRGAWFQYLQSDDAFLQWACALLEDSLRSGDPSQKNIAAYYSTYMSRDARDRGTLVLKRYMDEILAAKDAKALLPIIEKISAETGYPLLLCADALLVDMDEDGKCILSIETPSIDDDPNAYLPGGDAYDAGIVYCMTQALMLTGFTEQEAEKITEGYAQNQADWSTLWYAEKSIPRLEPQYDMIPYLQSLRYSIEKNQLTMDERYLDTVFRLMDNPNTFNSYQCACVCSLLEFSKYHVSPRILDWMNGWWIEMYSADMANFLDAGTMEIALYPELSQDICTTFSKKFDVTAASDQLEQVFATYKDHFAQMLQENSWLSDATRAEALKKLDAMDFYAGITPDTFNKETPQYVSAGNGGTLFENFCLFRKTDNANISRYFGMNLHSMDANIEFLSALRYNCYYDFDCNGVYVSLSYLYNDYMNADSQADYYANAITIGHEITHGFDINGSTYDWQGMKNDWWSAEDRAHFETLCARVADYYNQMEYAPGLRCDGTLNSGEDVADMGGLQMTLAVVKEIESFDYDSFFRCFASKYAMLSSRDGFAYILYPDPHAMNRVRINALFSLADEFYATYGIQEEDGMYVPPRQRLRVWASRRTAPAITKQPEAQYAVVGQQATFMIDATGDGLTYQWYINRNDGRGWRKLDGQTGIGHTTMAVALENDGYQYRCDVTDSARITLQSKIAILHVSEANIPPETGDSTNPSLWRGMCLLGGLGLALTMRKKEA